MNRIAVAVLLSFGIHTAALASTRDAGVDPNAPVGCESDAECPRLACGPCDAGTPITQAMLGGPECAVNPCLDASAVCNEKHTCEIGPRTRRNPAVWRKR